MLCQWSFLSQSAGCTQSVSESWTAMDEFRFQREFDFSLVVEWNFVLYWKCTVSRFGAADISDLRHLLSAFLLLVLARIILRYINVPNFSHVKQSVTFLRV